MTISLYFTVTPAGTLLCQGRDCPAWDSQEYDVLRDIVSADDVGFYVLGCRADILGTNCNKLFKEVGGGGGGGVD